MSRKKRRKKRKKGFGVSPQKRPPQLIEEEQHPKEKPKKKKIPAYFFFFFLFLIGLATFLIIRFLIPEKEVKKNSSLNVLLITLDTTRADRLGCYGYQKAKTPNIDSLAANGVQFLNSYCQVPLTCPSHCSILTGTYPLYHRVRNNGTYYLSPDLLTLAEVLKEKGFRTAAFVSSFTVDSRFGLDQGFDVYDDKFAEAQAFKALNSERKAEKVYAAFEEWLDKNSTEQFFCWIHFFDPHFPYDPPSPYREEFLYSPYDGEIAYMDYYVGKTVEKLKEKNRLGKTLIILAGDHGEAFGEKEEEGHGVFLYESTMKIPLILYAEDHLPQGKAINARVRLIDLMPSILEILEIPVPEEIHGVSLLPYIQGRKKAHLSNYMETYYPRENYGWSELVGLIDGNWKYIRAPKEELYNLALDPEEQKNLIQEEKEIHLGNKKKLEKIIKTYSSQFEARMKSMTAEEKERLRSLGYIGMGESPSRGELPDPKDRIEELLLAQQAQKYEFEENYQEAAVIYEKILSLSPYVATNYVNLALMQARMLKFDDAIQTLEQGLSKIPDSEILLSRLGHTFLVTGRLKKALDAFGQILKINPRYFDALLASAWILNFMGEKEEAQDFYRKALEVEPENKFARKNYAMSLATSGKIAQAVDIYNKLKGAYPDDYEIYQDLGIAYGYAGEITKSIENLEKAISIHPTPLAYYNLAVAMKKVGKPEEAAHYLKLYLENPEGEDEEKILRARHELQNIEKILKK